MFLLYIYGTYIFYGIYDIYEYIQKMMYAIGFIVFIYVNLFISFYIYIYTVYPAPY